LTAATIATATRATATTDGIAIATWWTETRDEQTNRKPKLKCCSPTCLRFGVAGKKKLDTKKKNKQKKNQHQQYNGRLKIS